MPRQKCSILNLSKIVVAGGQDSDDHPSLKIHYPKYDDDNILVKYGRIEVNSKQNYSLEKVFESKKNEEEDTKMTVWAVIDNSSKICDALIV